MLCESSSDTVTMDYGVGVNEAKNGSITIYPNPAQDVVNVVSTEVIEQMRVMNFMGQTVYSNTAVNNKKSQFNVSTLQSGVYFLKVTTAKGTKTVKVTVAH